MRIFRVLVLALLFGGCSALTEPDAARRLVEQDGVTQVHITGYRWFACGRDDVYQTGFRGLKNGKPISGVLCSGVFFKAHTLRYD